MNEESLRAILEGRTRGIGPFCLRALLALPGIAYGVAMKFRRAAYDAGVLKSFGVDVPVISVGNLTVGGTGKTPFTCALARELSRRGYAPAIVARGYGSDDPDNADEILLYRKLLPQVKVHAGRDRVESARLAADNGADIILVDDGFQHLRLRRDFDIVLLDAAYPYGGGVPIPGGLLREFPSALKCADAVCITRTENASADVIAGLEKELLENLPRLKILRSSHEPARLKRFSGEDAGLESLRGSKVIAVCGIARPDSFFSTLKALGAEIVRTLAFPDHHGYSQADVDSIAKLAKSLDAEPVTTEKDAVKLLPLMGENSGLLALGIELRITGLAEILDQAGFPEKAG